MSKTQNKTKYFVIKKTSAHWVQKTSHFLRENTISSFALLHVIHVTSCSKMFINFLSHKFCCLVAQLCLPLWIPWTAAHQASLSFTISQSLFKLMSIDAIQLSPSLLPPSPLNINISQKIQYIYLPLPNILIYFIHLKSIICNHYISWKIRPII